MSAPFSTLDETAAQAAFVAAMRRPEAYASPTTAAGIRCVETHVSWVFLTGRYAYKVKKPVRLSFLDYSTAARREAMCREELRLNQRHAPGLYLDVVPIAGRPDRPRVGDPEGDPFEHALRMVQFERQCELTQLLGSGDLTSDEVAGLGLDLARSHATAAVAEIESGFGVPELLHRVTLDNFVEIERASQRDDGIVADPAFAAGTEHADLRARLSSILADTGTRFDQVRTSMQSRRQAGFVRECHGDLHCGNVVRWQGRLLPFDGLEFDPALRFIDVASDLAFLTMDLAARGREDLRRTVLNAWTEASGDFAAIVLLPYYETYRALVRAKVAVLGRRRDSEPRDRREALRYLEWADGRSARVRPRLVLTVGLAGSGKTTLARQLAPQIDAFHVRSDIERKRLAGLGPLEESASPPDAGIYTREFTTRTYARLLEVARQCLDGGESVIVDAANLRGPERAQFAALAESANVPFAMMHCTAPLETLKGRVAARARSGADASEATIDLLERQPSYWEPFTELERSDVIEVDTGAPGAIDRAAAGLWRLGSGATD